MKPAYRTGFFLAAVFLFLVAAPLLILRASGFRYDFQDMSLVPTGTLVLKTYPEGATVLINDRKQGLTTPAEISGLPPERYLIRVEAENYYPWQKQLEIRQNQVTAEEEILLIPKKIPVSTLVPQGVRAFALSPDGRHLVFAQRMNHGDEIRLLHLSEKKEEFLHRIEQAHDKAAGPTTDTVERFLWSPDGRHIAVSYLNRNNQTRRYFLIGLSAEDKPFELPGLSGGIRDWSWGTLEPSFFFIHRQRLYRVDYSTKRVELLISEPVRVYTVIRDEIYFLTVASQALFKRNIGLESQAPVEVASLDALQGAARFITRNHTKIGLLDSGGRLWMIDLNGRSGTYPIASGVRDASFNEEGDRLLLQTSEGLSVYRLEKDSLLSDEKLGRAERVVHSKDKLFSPLWHHRHPYIFYAGKEAVFIAPVGGEGTAAYPVVKTPGEEPRFSYAPRSGGEKLYFLYQEGIYEADLSFEKAGSAEAPRLRTAKLEAR